MEVDNEVKGNGNSYTTEFRQYDPRLGRWLSLDPLMAQFPSMSPYVAFDNNPVYYIDPYGLSSSVKDPEEPEGGGETYVDDNGVTRTTTHAGGTGKPTERQWLEQKLKNGIAWLFDNAGAIIDGLVDMANYTPEGTIMMGNQKFIPKNGGYYNDDVEINDLRDIDKHILENGYFEEYTPEYLGSQLDKWANYSFSEQLEYVRIKFVKQASRDVAREETAALRELMQIRIILGGEAPGLINPGLLSSV